MAGEEMDGGGELQLEGEGQGKNSLVLDVYRW